MSTGTMDQVERHAGPMVDPGWVNDHLDDPELRVVEVDVSAAAYDAGHVPGAVIWNAYTDLRHPDYSPVDAAELAELLAGSGITPASTVVLHGYAAHLGFWLMKRYRHQRVLLMDGPRERWERTGLKWSSVKPEIAPSAYGRLTEDHEAVASREVVEGLIGRSGTTILDVRSQAEFDGERFWPSGATADTGRAGHIPGAVHIPFDLLRDEEGMLKSPAELRALCLANGLRPDQRVVTYCTIGNRASQFWFVLRYLLGYPSASVYYGSWVEWGKLAETPIEI